MKHNMGSYSFQLCCGVKAKYPAELSENAVRQLIAKDLQLLLNAFRTSRTKLANCQIESLELHDENADAQKLRELVGEMIDNEDQTLDDDAGVSLIDDPRSKHIEADVAGHVQIWQYVEFNREEPTDES